MGASQSELQKHFVGLSDMALVELRREDLVEAAKAIYDQEMSRRGLSAEVEAAAPELSKGEELVNVVEFEHAADAAHAQEQLKKNGIPAYIGVAVPAAFARQAIQLLDPGVPDDELAALAEASDLPEEER